MWGGRFSEPTDEFVQAMTASVSFDRRLANADIDGSIAHAKTLHRASVLNEEELRLITRGLDQIRDEINQDTFPWSVALEDVHMNIEARLTELIGDAGKKLHTGRSRNDQIATDIRLYLRERVAFTMSGVRSLQQGMLDLAEREADTVMPGFTHLQVAQPVSLGHHLMAWFEMLQRDHGRLGDCARLRLEHVQTDNGQNDPQIGEELLHIRDICFGQSAAAGVWIDHFLPPSA